MLLRNSHNISYQMIIINFDFHWQMAILVYYDFLLFFQMHAITLFLPLESFALCRNMRFNILITSEPNAMLSMNTIQNRCDGCACKVSSLRWWTVFFFVLLFRVFSCFDVFFSIPIHTLQLDLWYVDYACASSSSWFIDWSLACSLVYSWPIKTIYNGRCWNATEIFERYVKGETQFNAAKSFRMFNKIVMGLFQFSNGHKMHTSFASLRDHKFIQHTYYNSSSSRLTFCGQEIKWKTR